jgi:hypothetical protein
LGFSVATLVSFKTVPKTAILYKWQVSCLFCVL